MLQAGALAGAVGSIVGLLFTFVPALRPGGGGGGTSVSAVIPGTTDKVTLSLDDDAVRPLTWGAYMRELGVASKDVTGDPGKGGIVIEYQLEFPGYPKGTDLRIRYELYRFAQGERIFVRQQRESIQLDADSDYCTCTSDFIGLPRGDAIYRVEIAVFRPNAEFSAPLVEARTDPFAGTA